MQVLHKPLSSAKPYLAVAAVLGAALLLTAWLARSGWPAAVHTGSAGAVWAKFRFTARACLPQLGSPKVALLFLLRGELPQEATWKLWFASARALAPLNYLPGSACNTRAHKYSVRSLGNCSTLDQQMLFSVYAHPAPDYPPYPDGHLFNGREVPDRVQVEWGTHSVTVAMQRLLQEAVLSPLNQRFVLLCEASLPLYPPRVVYQQLMSEGKSRQASCFNNMAAWVGEYESEALNFHASHFRKNGQWFMLMRAHAQLVADNVKLMDHFAAVCSCSIPQQQCSEGWHCYSDEHYIPSLLAWAERGHETTCGGHDVMFSAWGNNQPHPRTYFTPDIGPDTFNAMRGSRGPLLCDYEQIMRAANQPQLFQQLQPGSHLTCTPTGSAAYADARQENATGCFLFARKFAWDSASAVYDVMTSCSDSLGIIDLDTAGVQCTKQ